MEIQIREISSISIVDIKGKLAEQEANEQLRDTVDSLLAKNKKHILLNLSQMEYIDSSSVGEPMIAIVPPAGSPLTTKLSDEGRFDRLAWP